jgi:hypothetical protein
MKAPGNPSRRGSRAGLARARARCPGTHSPSRGQAGLDTPPPSGALGKVQVEALQATLALVGQPGPVRPARAKRLCATVDGYTIHAAVTVGKDDRSAALPFKAGCRAGARGCPSPDAARPRTWAAPDRARSNEALAAGVQFVLDVSAGISAKLLEPFTKRTSPMSWALHPSRGASGTMRGKKPASSSATAWPPAWPPAWLPSAQ